MTWALAEDRYKWHSLDLKSKQASILVNPLEKYWKVL